MKKITLTLTLSILSSIITVFIYNFFSQNEEEKKVLFTSAPIKTTNSTNQFNPNIDFTQACEKTIESVVSITTLQTVSINPFNSFFWGFSNSEKKIIPTNNGSGVILSKEGYIITNNHVLEGAERIKVTLNDKRSFDAKIIGTDANTDIALLKIDADDLSFLSFADSDNIKIGQWVLAVGNPFNLTSTVTAGIISALNRNINTKNGQIDAFIQTDAVINPGNSGGALVNTNGELIGINTAIASHSGTFEGYSFAIPSNIARKVVEDLLQYGIVNRAYLGIEMRELDSELSSSIGTKTSQGIYVHNVIKGSSSEKSGLKKGDIILEIDGKKIKDNSDLTGFLSSKRPGDEVNILIERKREKQTLKVILQNMYGTTTHIDGKNNINFLNAIIRPISQIEKNKYKIDYGMTIEDLGNSPFSFYNMQKGDIILTINNKKMYTADDIKIILKSSKKNYYEILALTKEGLVRLYIK